MTVALSGEDVAAKLEQNFADSIVESNKESICVKGEAFFEIVSFLQTDPEFAFNYLANITAVDYFEYFEVIYHLVSMEHNHSLVIKTRCPERENPSVPSITSIFRGADYQEREIYDLMGIRFEGHPNMKRILLWDGFQGHPLRKDYL